LGFLGSSNLTFSGLVRQGELNIDVTDEDATDKLLTWFRERWDDELAIDVTDELVAILDESWVSTDQPDPYLVYLRMAYELSADAREGLRDYDIPASLRDVLLEHQADAVRVAARIVERRGGAMIGDVVGLGKTLTAIAIARLMQEQHNFETLIIAPRNLVRMWEDHIHEYRIYGRVVSLSMATKELDKLPRYRLLIVDESHNLRNPQTQQWRAVRGYIERNDPGVLLLTATPYNKAFSDAAGQLRLWIPEDQDLGIRPEELIKDEGDLAVAKSADGQLSTLKAFEGSTFPDDWQRLMSLFLVRRTRRFIEQQYGHADAAGRIMLRFSDGHEFYFPTRVPQPLPYAGGPSDPGDRLASTATVDALNELKLPRYTLGSYLRDGVAGQNDLERGALARLERARGNLQGFIRTMLMKRLSSCGEAFLISVRRHLLRNHVALYAIEHAFPIPLGTIEDSRWEPVSDDDPDATLGDDVLVADVAPDQPDWRSEARERYEVLTAHPPSNVTWLPAEFFTPALKDVLREDNAILEQLIGDHSPWDPAQDSKIDALERLISTEHPNSKVLVFTEYADTAEYVGRTLQTRLGSQWIESVTGQSSDPTVAARCFSPKSNAALGGLPQGRDELRVLVATDVLSEGQNLQDAHIVVNYDLPWTIIRIIQRAGRVDRVGQESPEVDVYSFLPQDGVEEVINLRHRITERLRENAAVFGSDERFFEDDLTEDQVRGLFDGRAVLDEDEGDEDVDWASRALAIWEQAPPDLQDAAAALPCVTYSTRPRRGDDGTGGVLVYTRTTRGLDGLAWTDDPAATGPTARILTPFEALRLASCSPSDSPDPRREDHHALVEWAVRTTLLDAVRQPLALTHSGIRARLYNTLETVRQGIEGTLFDTADYRKLVEAVYHRPLTETAKHRIAKALRERSPSDVAALASDLDEMDELLVRIDDRNEELQIVCSLGIPGAA
jgi:superfamily II DNA or RNA helicase